MVKFATFKSNGKSHYGTIHDAGFAALDPLFPEWPTLFDAVKNNGLSTLEEAAEEADISHESFEYDMVLPNVQRILCVWVNFPERNAEYKDHSTAPKYMSLFVRFPSSFTGHNQPLILPPENKTLDYEGEVAIVIGKGGRRISKARAYDHISALTISNEGTIRD